MTTPETPPVELPAPTNVLEALARVMLDLPGIAKKTGPEHGGRADVGYAYRSIEQITAEAQSLFGKYGVIFVPRVLPVQADDDGWARMLDVMKSCENVISDPLLDKLVEATAEHSRGERSYITGEKKTRWADVHLSVEFTIYGPGGPEDKIVAGPFRVVGRDNSDKGYNKAMTQAFKQCLLVVLCVGDPQDEGEHVRHEQEGATPTGAPPTDEPPIAIEDAAAISDRMKALPADDLDRLKEMWKRRNLPTKLTDLTEHQAKFAREIIKAHEDAAAKTGHDVEASVTAVREAREAAMAAQAADGGAGAAAASDGPTVDGEAPGVDEAPTGAPDVPPGAEAASDGPTDPETPPEPAPPAQDGPLAVPSEEDTDQALADVKAMRLGDVRTALNERGLSTEGDSAAVRNRLAFRLAAERATERERSAS